MNASPVVHACGCEFPGPSCQAMVALKAEKDAAWGELLAAADALDDADDRFARQEAETRYREAEAEHERLRKEYLDHRVNGGQVERDEEAPGGDRAPAEG